MGIGIIGLSASGIALGWDGKAGKLVIGSGARSDAADVRTAGQMRDVLMEPRAKMPEVFYYMCRDVCMEKDWAGIKKADLKFCITVWPAFAVGGEYNKTYGHFHSSAPGTKIAYPEIYEVLHGSARFIQQSENGKEFFAVEAKENDKVVMPPGFGHVTVNTGKKTLITMDCSARACKSDYGPFKEMRGAMYYDTQKGFVKNKNYETAGFRIPELVMGNPGLAEKFGFGKKSIYKEYLENPEIMDFLKRPQDAQHFAIYLTKSTSICE